MWKILPNCEKNENYFPQYSFFLKEKLPNFEEKRFEKYSSHLDSDFSLVAIFQLV
jgi:hypothetical protein